MSIEKFPDIGRFKVSDTSENVFAGGFTMQDALQLRQIICHVYKHGALAGTETLVARVYTDSALTKMLCESSAFSLNTITMGTYWRGTIPLEFPTKNYLDINKVYYVTFALAGYTRNADTFYVSFLVDDYDPINVTTGDNALHCAFIGYNIKDSEI